MWAANIPIEYESETKSVVKGQEPKVIISPRLMSFTHCGMAFVSYGSASEIVKSSAKVEKEKIVKSAKNAAQNFFKAQSFFACE